MKFLNLKSTLTNNLFAFTILVGVVYSAVSFGATSNQMLHPMIVKSPVGYHYKTVNVGQPIYIRALSKSGKTSSSIVLESFPTDLGFHQDRGLRLIQTHQRERKSEADIPLIILRAEFRPNLAVAYDVSEDGANEIPDWLKQNFARTNSVITTRDEQTGEPGPSFVVFEHMGTKNDVTLGGNGSAKNMYLILVRSGEGFQFKN